LFEERRDYCLGNKFRMCTPQSGTYYIIINKNAFNADKVKLVKRCGHKG
jgi:hypothetical protein